jgi:hypothetical protein
VTRAMRDTAPKSGRQRGIQISLGSGTESRRDAGNRKSRRRTSVRSSRGFARATQKHAAIIVGRSRPGAKERAEPQIGARADSIPHARSTASCVPQRARDRAREPLARTRARANPVARSRITALRQQLGTRDRRPEPVRHRTARHS